MNRLESVLARGAQDTAGVPFAEMLKHVLTVMDQSVAARVVALEKIAFDMSAGEGV